MNRDMTDNKTKKNSEIRIVIALLGILLIGGIIFYASEIQKEDQEMYSEIDQILQNAQQRTAVNNPYEMRLEVQAWGWRVEHGYAIVEGEVKNITDKRLENIQIVAKFYTQDGQFITSDNALIDYNPILSQQTSPFKALSTHNPMMHSVRIEFQELMGGRVYHSSVE